MKFIFSALFKTSAVKKTVTALCLMPLSALAVTWHNAAEAPFALYGKIAEAPGYALTFAVMLIPGTPKDLISYFIGLTDMKLHEWIVISTIARIPSIVTSTLGGNALAEQNYLFAVIVFVITAAISIVGILVYNKISRRREEKKSSKS